MTLSDADASRKLSLSHVKAPKFSNSSADCTQINASLIA